MKTLRLVLLALVPSAIAMAQATITSTSPLPPGTVGQAYSYTLTCTNCNGFPWLVSSGSLPPSLALDSASGTISGTTTTAGTYNFTIELNTFNTPVFKNFSIAVNSALAIATKSVPNGTVGVPYSTTLIATGGTPPYTWSIMTGSLPAGLGISTDGVISGTPTTQGVNTFTVTVADNFEVTAQATYTMTIFNPGTAPAITTTTLPNGVVNQGYSGQLNCTNCAFYFWSISSGLLPPGLSLGSRTGSITGTPTVLGAFPFQVSLQPTSPTSGQPPLTQNFSITITNNAVTINESTLPVAFVNTPYNAPLTGSGGTPPYTWALQSTNNDGLAINANTGVISGTPTAAGQFAINVLITDSGGATAMKGFALNVSLGLSILTTSLPNGTLNAAYPAQTLSAGGGQPPYRWTISNGTLPPGLTLDGIFGRISGMPTAGGAFPFKLTVTDNQQNTASATLSITVGGVITITPATLAAGAVGTAYTQTLSAAGGTAPYVWSLAIGTLPAGLTLNASTGTISGVPTSPATAAFTVQATDSTQAFGQARLTLTITGPVTITTTSLPDATIGVVYSQNVSVSGGTTPYSWAVTTGSLPSGLTLNASTGVIGGTPTAAANSAFTITVIDAAGTTAKQALSIATAAALTVTPTTLPAAVVGVAFTQKFTAAGGKAPYTYAVTGTLPAGFNFNPATATIAGTAPAAETGNFTLTVTDSSGRTVALPLTLTAAAAPLSLTPTTLTAVVGVAFTQKLTVTGGVAPYTFALGLGNPPNGFKFDTATGTISGTAPVAESGFINVTVTDSSGAKGTTFAIILTATNPPVPTVTVTLSGAGSGFTQQIPVAIAIGAPYPLNIAGAVSLNFAPAVTPAAGVADGMIQFASGGTVINFTIPAGSTTPTFPSGANPTVLTGTTAGTITVVTSLTVNGVALGNTNKTIVNPAGVPFISSVTFQQTPGGVTVTVVGFSSTRDMVSGLFHFAPASNVSFTQSDITVPLASAFTAWWSNTAQSNPYGTQFTLTVPFTLSTQSTSVVSVTVTLTNSKGASNPVTLNQ